MLYADSLSAYSRKCNNSALAAQVRPLKHTPQLESSCPALDGCRAGDPVANHTGGVLLAFEAMAVGALLLPVRMARSVMPFCCGQYGVTRPPIFVPSASRDSDLLRRLQIRWGPVC